MRNLILAVMVLIGGSAFAQSSFGEVIGTVMDRNTNEPIFGAAVFINDDGRKYQSKTDFDGRFRISQVPAGTYYVNIINLGDTMSLIEAKIPMDGYCNLGSIAFGAKVMDVVEVSANDMKLEFGELPVKTLTAEEIDKSPSKFDVKGLVTSMSSEVRQTEDGELVFRGARKGDMLYLVDGVKSSNIGSIPGVAIGRMQVYTGGLPAKYGDTMGGVIVLETKSYFDLYREYRIEEGRKERLKNKNK
ncbi:MAG: TonB-dependent receptor [Bacteroidota bacterium]